MTALILSAALKGTVLLVVAWMATLLLRRSSADVRHRVWLAAICGVPLLMIPVRAPEVARVEFVYSIAASAEPIAAAPAATNWWAAVWAVGFGLVLVRFVVGVARLYWISSKSEQRDGVRFSDAVATPLTWGAFRAEVLLPGYARGWSAEKLAIAVAHERAHIARWDWLTQSVAQVATAVFWFHPLMWFATAQLRQEAEQAVDNAVLSNGTEAASYAEQLLDVARRLNGNAQATAVAMVRKPVLTGRIEAILDSRRIRTIAGWPTRVAILAVGVWLLLALAPFEKTVQAQVVPAPAAPAPAPVVVPTPAPAPVRVPTPTPIAAPTPAPVPTPAPEPTRSYVPTPATAVGAYPIGNGVTAPVVVNKVEPVYSEEAREAKLQGEVWISGVVDENGIPTQLVVTRSLGLGLDEAALEAVHQWRFKPGMTYGEPVSTKVTLSVSFHLL